MVFFRASRGEVEPSGGSGRHLRQRENAAHHRRLLFRFRETGWIEIAIRLRAFMNFKSPDCTDRPSAELFRDSFTVWEPPAGPLRFLSLRREIMACEHPFESHAQISFLGSWRRHPCRCRGFVGLGRISGDVPRAEPRNSRRIFVGDDRGRLSGVPIGAQTCGGGLVQGDYAGSGFSFLGGESVLAQFSAGHAVQRYCHRALCAGCISGHHWLAGGRARQQVSEWASRRMGPLRFPTFPAKGAGKMGHGGFVAC